MINFKRKLEEKKAESAYVLGIDAFYSKTPNPFLEGSKAYMEWISGLQDAIFIAGDLRNGYKIGC